VERLKPLPGGASDGWDPPRDEPTSDESAPIAAAAVREQLARMLASPDFDASARNRRFLAFVVEEALEGRAGRIKAYSIATAVFSRAKDFDPQADPIVRIEAGRLRRSMERYYLRGGRADAVVISIPRGSYAPVFLHRAPVEASPPAAARAGDARRLRVIVHPFDADAAIAGLERLSRGFTRHVTVALLHVARLEVFQGAGAGEADFVLTGGMELADGRLSVDVLLHEVASGRCLWGDTFRSGAAPEEMLRIRDRVAEAVVLALGQPYGAVFDAKLRDLEAKGADALTSYEFVLRFYQYWRRLDRSSYAEVRAGLERAVAADPGHAEALGCLSLLCTDAVRYRLRGHEGRPDAQEAARAMDLARQAIAAAPNTSIGHHALGLSLWFAGHADEAFAAFEEGLRVNPYDSDLMAELGLRRALLGAWDRGVRLLQDSYAANPAQPSFYRIGLALWHHAMGRHAEALGEIARIDAQGAIHVSVLEAAAAAALGDTARADRAARAVLAIDPTYPAIAAVDLRARGLAPNLVALVVAGLAHAGLPTPSGAAALQ
jgi:adenylate cyclase